MSVTIGESDYVIYAPTHREGDPVDVLSHTSGEAYWRVVRGGMSREAAEALLAEMSGGKVPPVSAMHHAPAGLPPVSVSPEDRAAANVAANLAEWDKLAPEEKAAEAAEHTAAVREAIAEPVKPKRGRKKLAGGDITRTCNGCGKVYAAANWPANGCPCLAEPERVPDKKGQFSLF